MISELKEIECKICKKKKLNSRKRIETEYYMKQDNETVRRNYWICICDECGYWNKVLWDEQTIIR